MKPGTHFDTHTLVRDGAEAYARALANAGGNELEAQMRNGDRTAVCAAIYASPPYDLRVPALPVSRLSVNLTRARVSGGVSGERHRSYEALRYSMFLVPAGVPASWRKEAPSRHVSIYFHPGAFGGSGDDDVVFEPGMPIFNARIPGIRQLADQLGAELDRPDTLTAEAADSLARLLLVRLGRMMLDPGALLNPLTARMLTNVRDYIAAHLAERILVADLARVAGLSPNRFAQAFNDHMRLSPHRFVLSLRLDRAAQLLRASNLELVDVAQECGFANQQHLCNSMRRHLGTTPSRYRRAHGLRTEGKGRIHAGPAS